MATILEARQLNLKFANQQILNDINLAIEAGEFVVILGPNGSGKTSLINCLCCHYSSYTGEVLLGDRSLKSLSRREIAQQIALLPQHGSAELHLTVKQVVELGLIPQLSLFSLADKQLVATIDDAIDQLDLTPLAERPFKDLSGGEQQRVQLARIMVQNAPLVLLDEPTNHLDIAHQVQIMRQVKAMQVTAVACLHDLNLAATYADRIILLNQGKIIANGQPDQVLNADQLSTIYGVQVDVDINPLNQQRRITFNLSGGDL